MERLKGILVRFSNPAHVKMLYVIAVVIIMALPFGAPDATGGP